MAYFVLEFKWLLLFRYIFWLCFPFCVDSSWQAEEHTYHAVHFHRTIFAMSPISSALNPETIIWFCFTLRKYAMLLENLTYSCPPSKKKQKRRLVLYSWTYIVKWKIYSEEVPSCSSFLGMCSTTSQPPCLMYIWANINWFYVRLEGEGQEGESSTLSVLHSWHLGKRSCDFV